MLKRIRNLWCEMLHHDRTWPINGQYKCRSCGRLYLVPWAGSVRELKRAETH
jgi:hypothetical protein